MSVRTVDWTARGAPRAGAPGAEGLRERKKRLMRQQLSDTATEMFMERGFDAVRVAEVAEACGVSEKTVFNYFPTKESLVLDRWDATMASLRTGLAEPWVAPVEAALRILDTELSGMTAWLAAQDDPAQATAAIRRFGELIRATPALRAHQRDMMDRLVTMAAGLLAGRAGMSPDDPEPQIAATALLGLWDIQFRALRKYLDGTRPPAEVYEAITADVQRAAQLIDSGLSSFRAFLPRLSAERAAVRAALHAGAVVAGPRPKLRLIWMPRPLLAAPRVRVWLLGFAGGVPGSRPAPRVRQAGVPDSVHRRNTPTCAPGHAPSQGMVPSPSRPRMPAACARTSS